MDKARKLDQKFPFAKIAGRLNTRQCSYPTLSFFLKFFNFIRCKSSLATFESYLKFFILDVIFDFSCKNAVLH